MLLQILSVLQYEERFREEIKCLCVLPKMHHVCLDNPPHPPSAPPITPLKQKNALEMKSDYLQFSKCSICLQSTKAQEKPQVAHQTTVAHLLEFNFGENQQKSNSRVDVILHIFILSDSTGCLFEHFKVHLVAAFYYYYYCMVFIARVFPVVLEI